MIHFLELEFHAACAALLGVPHELFVDITFFLLICTTNSLATINRNMPSQNLQELRDNGT